MTDHKAEWPAGVLSREATLKLLREHNEWRRGASTAQTDPRMLGLALDAAIAALTAAPAASEGEDGAVPFGHYFRDASGCQHFHTGATPPSFAQSGITPLYTLPAAQVAATPKHDEGRYAVILKALGDAYADDPDISIHDAAQCVSAALATQPAARRVTDEDARKAYAAFCTDKPFDAIRAMRAALESFAQPAEGVSDVD